MEPTYIQKKDQIGYLKIDKINLYQPLFNIKSKHNNIEENITILEDSIMPDNENSIVFLAAHSGTGTIAFFQYLNKLKVGDKVKLKYKDKLYNYTINNIWEETKTGYIHINKAKQKQLILTTCSPNNKDKQLIIESMLST